MFGTGGRFRYRRCDKCEALVLLDIPESMDPYYPSDYYSLAEFALPGKRSFLARSRRRLWMNLLLRSPIALVDRLVEAGRAPEFARWLAGRRVSARASVLDVGCGSGWLLVEMRQYGFTRLLGIDPYLAKSRDVAGVRLEPRTLDELSGTFDVVILDHSFEHMGGARRVLGAIRNVLAPGGTVVIRTPVADSFASREYGANWVQLDAPRHLEIPTEAGIGWASRAAGLRVVRSYRDGSEFQFWGSEQYCLQIPLSAPKSWFVDQAASPFTQSQINAWEEQARELNERGEGDQATFVLTHCL